MRPAASCPAAVHLPAARRQCAGCFALLFHGCSPFRTRRRTRACPCWRAQCCIQFNIVFTFLQEILGKQNNFSVQYKLLMDFGQNANDCAKIARKRSKTCILVYEFLKHEHICGQSCCGRQQSNCCTACKGLVWEISGRMRSVHLMHRCFARPRKKKYLFTFALGTGRNFVGYVEYCRNICEKLPTDIPKTC